MQTRIRVVQGAPAQDTVPLRNQAGEQAQLSMFPKHLTSATQAVDMEEAEVRVE